MAVSSELRVIEKSCISPPPNTAVERSLSLTIFDLVWLIFPPVHQLFFYDFPHPKSHFVESVIPKLKHSLSITLQHFSPFAGNLVVFPSANGSDVPRKPEIRYAKGDSLSIIFAECDHLDDELKQNHPRECNKFYSLVPLLEAPVKASDHVKIPVFSIQVTFFPNSSIAIGLTNHHSLCDAKTMHDFMMAWTSVHKHGTDELFLANKYLPFYDRVIEYPRSLDDSMLSLPPMKTIDETYRARQLDPQTDKLRYTLVLTRSQINSLKKWLLVQLPALEYVSSFVVGCCFTWSCVAKSRVQVQGTKGEYEAERFLCSADWRARLNPPLPQTYFGNCVGPCTATTKTSLITDNKLGFPTAVELLATGIREALTGERGLAKDGVLWMENLSVQVPTMSVAGTPKLRVYDTDFGWGKPVKYETISIDYSDTLSVNASKDSPEDLEIGLCLPPKQMDAFITIFQNELESMLSHNF